MKHIYIIFFLLLASLSSCSKKTASSRLKNRPGAVSLLLEEAVQESSHAAENAIHAGRKISYIKRQPYEERATDIPLPVGALAVPGYEDTVYDSGLFIIRSTMLLPQEVTDFYRDMLEQTGWYLKAQSLGEHEQLMVWEKPSRICVISVRQHPIPTRSTNKSLKTFLVIHAAKKEAGT